MDTNNPRDDTGLSVTPDPHERTFDPQNDTILT
jgi:hypothetical protein